MRLNRIRDYLRLGRIHSAVLAGLAPVCATIVLGISLPLSHYLELFLIGFLFHVYLFILNEVQDVKIDKTSNDLKDKPLVDGSISIKSARAIVFSSAFIIILFSFVFFYDNALILIIISLIAFLLGWLYDSFGKKIPHADYSIALMLFFVALYGPFSVTNNIPNLAYIIAAIAFIQVLFQNIVAGLKDVDHDFMAGGLSTPLRLGVRVEKERFIVSKRFIAYIFTLKTIHVSLILLPFVYNFIEYEPWQLFVVLLLIFFTVVFMARFLFIKMFQREKIMRAIGFHEMFIFMTIPIILYGFIGYVATLFLLVLPVLWLGVFLVIMYGRLMPEI